jgi:hypothetical protein
MVNGYNPKPEIFMAVGLPVILSAPSRVAQGLGDGNNLDGLLE